MSLHAIEQTRLRRQHRVDGVGRPKFDFHTGIYSRPHKLLNALSRPLFWLFATTRPNTVGVGNSFDNMRLHSVGAGAPRLSYVLRLVRKDGGVTMSPATVATCASRSTACERLTKVLAPAVSSEVPAGTFAWAGLAADL